MGRHVEHVMYLVSGCVRTASAPAPTLLHKLLTSVVWAGWSKGTQQIEGGTVGVLQLSAAPWWCQALWASPEAICLTKILFTISQRCCQPPISITMPAALYGNKFLSWCRRRTMLVYLSLCSLVFLSFVSHLSLPCSFLCLHFFILIFLPTLNPNYCPLLSI